MALGFDGGGFADMKRKLFLVLALYTTAACVFVTTASVMKPPEPHRKMVLRSNAFKDGDPIPALYTCDDKNISPPLAWTGAPSGTVSLALIVDDPDAPTGVWTHWVVFNISTDASGLAEDAAKSDPAMKTVKQGLNDFKNPGYGGPCPPAGKQHRYYFKLYALDTALNLPARASKNDVEAAMAKHILAAGTFMGTYQRK
jgi:Raf kinase inhibitor-like YbhB/YbcL family protein